LLAVASLRFARSLNHSLMIVSVSLHLVVLAKHGCKCNNKDCEQSECKGRRRFLTSPTERIGKIVKRMHLARARVHVG
jgi:hypothetical protein